MYTLTVEFITVSLGYGTNTIRIAVASARLHCVPTGVVASKFMNMALLRDAATLMVTHPTRLDTII